MSVSQERPPISKALASAGTRVRRIVTGRHVDEGVWQVGVIGITTRPPLKDQANGLVDEKVEDGQINVKLVVVLILHAPCEVQVALSWQSVGGMAVWHCLGWVCGESGRERLVGSGQHESRRQESRIGVGVGVGVAVSDELQEEREGPSSSEGS